MFNSFYDFYLKSNSVTLSVLALLAIYFFILNWIFLYRFFYINSWKKSENESFESLLMGASSVSTSSYLSHFLRVASTFSNEIYKLSIYSATKEATKGLSMLSIVASTAPFIGLFGTVVSILDTFSHIGGTSGTMAIIAAGVSDALIATAAGIFVAIFAYTYHQVLKRKSYELINLIQMQGETLLARKEN
ncbi:MAG: MotA/TolQ/ExbB proton channel family protein [Campylobacterota bacterium]|nr:MotA/TolQ/ExbB proton channel family protein [Campylobacterota bacterium]